MPLFRTLTTAGALAAVLMSGTSAYALDAQAFADKLVTTLAQGSTPITVGSATADGDTVTLSGWSVQPQGVDKPLKIDAAVVFTGVAETGDGGFTAREASIADIEYTEDGMTLKVTGVRAENIKIPAAPEDDVLATAEIYEKFFAGPISVSKGGAELFAVDAVTVNNAWDDGAQKLTTGYDVTGIRADLSSIPDPEVSGMAALFGLSQLNATAKGSSIWTVSDGRVIVEEGSMTVSDVGKLNMTMDISGYTVEVIKQMQEMNKKMTDITANGGDPEEAGMGMMMAIMSQISFSGLSIRFDDDGITSKIIAFLAEQNDAPPEAMAAGFAAMLPAMAAEAGLPDDLKSQLATAATSFLTDPKNLEITVTTDNPLPIMAFAVAANDPTMVFNLVDVKITANQ